MKRRNLLKGALAAGVAASTCGRLAFDGRGHLFVSVGGKSTYDNLHVLDAPYGKIHRVRDDGSVRCAHRSALPRPLSRLWTGS